MLIPLRPSSASPVVCKSLFLIEKVLNNFVYSALLCIFAPNFTKEHLGQKERKEQIRALLEEALPLVDFDSDFLFSELDSLGVTTILMLLSDKFGIQLESTDATPKNLKTLDSIVAMVEGKLRVKSEE